MIVQVLENNLNKTSLKSGASCNFQVNFVAFVIYFKLFFYFIKFINHQASSHLKYTLYSPLKIKKTKARRFTQSATSLRVILFVSY